MNQESTGDEVSGSSSEEEPEEPPAKKTPGKYKVSLLAQVQIQGYCICYRCTSHYSPDSEGDFQLSKHQLPTAILL